MSLSEMYPFCSRSIWLKTYVGDVEYPFDVFRLVVFAGLQRHHLHELLEVDLAAQIRIVDGEYLVHEALLALVAAVLHHGLRCTTGIPCAGPSA